MTEKKEPVSRNEACYQIGEVADRTGVTQRTLRFYEERGLLNPPSRMDGGFRLYSEEDIDRVEQIKRLQGLLGLTLAEIKDMVDAEEVKTGLRASYRPDLDIEVHIERLSKAIEVTQRQHDIIDAKVSALAEMKADLEGKILRFRGRLKDAEEQRRARTSP